MTRLRTGLSWADSFRPDAERWFDRQMKALEAFDVTLTFCFTPEHCGILPNHTSPPREPESLRSSVRPWCAGMPDTKSRNFGDDRKDHSRSPWRDGGQPAGMFRGIGRYSADGNRKSAGRRACADNWAAVPPLQGVFK